MTGFTDQRSGSAAPPSGWARFFDRLVFFTWWVRLQQGLEEWPRARRLTLVVGAGVVGVAARLWAQTLPGNWDFGQWINVSTAALEGENPYALFGYNYPPPWLVTLMVFNAVTSTPESFRLLISLLLILADIGIAWLLVRRGYSLAACAVLLSPVVIAISGQHQQVEGIAVFLALAAVTALGTSSATPRITAQDWWLALLLGLSLSFKPVFLLLPLWLAMRPGAWGPRLFRLVAPLAIFGVIFASAFLVYPANVVIQKVLQHGGANNSRSSTPSSPSRWLRGSSSTVEARSRSSSS